MPVFGPAGDIPMPGERRSILNRDFVLLFLMSMCCNSYIAVYYCFEQWLEGAGVEATWRGILLACLFAMVLLTRPAAMVALAGRGRAIPLALSIIVSSLVMASYPLVGGEAIVPVTAALRLIQGASLAVLSTCVTSMLTTIIPPGQGARGFALFSLTLLLPYSMIPALGEKILPLVGEEPNLFAWTSLLGIPALCMVPPLAAHLRAEDSPGSGDVVGARAMLSAAAHSGLTCIHLACMTFSTMTWLAILFMKGLCLQTGENPALFFSIYTGTMIVIRLLGSHILDTLPRYRVVPLCALGMALSVLGMAWTPRWFEICCVIYGVSLALLYPLLAATIYDRSTAATRSLNSNVMMLSFDTAAMIGPLAGGAVLHMGLGYRGVFVAAALFVLASGALTILDRLLLARDGRRKRA